jgi:hypothetical protein
MAYLRSEKEIVEVDYPINTVWDAIGKALKGLEWKIEEVNEEKHQMKVKTKANFMAYASNMTIDVQQTKENVSRVNVSAETPVTTITGIVDFGRTRERIDSFFLGLIKQLKPPESSNAEKTEESP